MYSYTKIVEIGPGSFTVWDTNGGIGLKDEQAVLEYLSAAEKQARDHGSKLTVFVRRNGVDAPFEPLSASNLKQT